MKKYFYIIVLSFFTISCETVNDYSFDQSGPIEKDALEKVGNAIVKSLQLKNEQEFYRHFDKDLFKLKVAENLTYGLESVENDYGINYFIESAFEVLKDGEMSVRKFNLQQVFEENGKGIIVISSITENGIRFYEFIVTNYNNSHRIYDIYYTDLGFTLSDAIIKEFPYDWKGISYMDESSIWEIDNSYHQEEYEEVIQEFNKLQKESQEQPWMLGKFLGAIYQEGLYDGLDEKINRTPYNSDFLKYRLYRQMGSVDSLERYVNKIEARYGKSYLTSHFQQEVLYYKNELEAAEAGLLKSLLFENDHAAPYVYLTYISVEKDRYKDAVKYLKILQKKFRRDPEELKSIYADDEDFTSSKEYKAWLSSIIIRDVVSEAISQVELID